MTIISENTMVVMTTSEDLQYSTELTLENQDTRK